MCTPQADHLHSTSSQRRNDDCWWQREKGALDKQNCDVYAADWLGCLLSRLDHQYIFLCGKQRSCLFETNSLNLKVMMMLYKRFYTCRYTHRQLILSLADSGKDSPSLFLDRRDRFYSVACRGVFMGVFIRKVLYSKQFVSYRVPKKWSFVEK